MSRLVKITILAPINATESILKTLRDSGCGKTAQYDSWSVTSTAVERYRPLNDAKPYIGVTGSLTAGICHKIEVQCRESQWPEIVEKIKKIHPYEKPAIEVVSLLYPSLINER
ncbi:MAG: hypothetical protein OEY59_07895 [Deltaproteobacteria bacterium]|nr:hypothetical protein [Deltaproteobacteria bacterium]